MSGILHMVSRRFYTKLLHFTGRLKAFLCSSESRCCYLATAIFGTLSYLYLFVNNINNNDMIVCMPAGYGTGITSGRWLLQLLGDLTDRIWGVYNVPLFSGILALALLALTSAVIVKLLELKSPKVCFSVAAITATAAPIASSMFFLFTIHYFAFALLCVVTAAYFGKHAKLSSFLGASVLGACSLGIYQAYFPFFAVLLLLSVLISSLKQENSLRQIVIHALRALSILIFSYLLYRLMLSVALCLMDAQLGDYQGIGQIGSLTLSAIPQAYRDFFLLPFREYAGFNATQFLQAMLFCLILLSVVLCILHRKQCHCICTIICLLLLPLASNAFVVIAPNSTVYTRMCMGLMSVFYLPAVLAAHLPEKKSQPKKALQTVVCVLLLASSLNYAWQSNGNYQQAYYANRKTENYFATLFTRAKSTDGYRADMPIVLVGNNFSDESFVNNWANTPFLYRGNTSAASQINQYSRPQFVANYLGYAIRSATDEEIALYATQIETMTCYPDDGSLAVVDNLILVRLE